MGESAATPVIQQTVEQLVARAPDLEALFCVTVHRDERGTVIPTIYHAVGQELPDDRDDVYRAEMHRHLSGIAETLRKVYVRDTDASSESTVRAKAVGTQSIG